MELRILKGLRETPGKKKAADVLPLDKRTITHSIANVKEKVIVVETLGNEHFTFGWNARAALGRAWCLSFTLA